VKAELVEYPREPHGPQQEKDNLDILNRIAYWYDDNLSATGRYSSLTRMRWRERLGACTSASRVTAGGSYGAKMRIHQDRGIAGAGFWSNCGAAQGWAEVSKRNRGNELD
jgi:hypothetical protein